MNFMDLLYLYCESSILTKLGHFPLNMGAMLIKFGTSGDLCCCVSKISVFMSLLQNIFPCLNLWRILLTLLISCGESVASMFCTYARLDSHQRRIFV